MNEKDFVPSNTYFVSLRERISQCYLLIPLNALRKAVIATKIVFRFSIVRYNRINWQIKYTFICINGRKTN